MYYNGTNINTNVVLITSICKYTFKIIASNYYHMYLFYFFYIKLELLKLMYY